MQLRHQFGNYAGGLEHALALATLAHAEHRELTGALPTSFPSRTALAMPDSDAESRMIALLHDVVVETDVTIDDLRAEGFPEHILDAVHHWQSRISARPMASMEQLVRYRSALRVLDRTADAARTAI